MRYLAKSVVQLVAGETRKNMSARASHILVDEILSLEEVDLNLFRSKNHWKPLLNSMILFGGQFVSQALLAAGKTVDPQLHVHSLHSYFVRPGQNSCPILYQVERIRDGRNFATRTVSAKQDGKIMFTMQASFHREEFSQFQHQYTMPVAPPPEEVPTAEEIGAKYYDQLPGNMQALVGRREEADVPIERRYVYPEIAALPFPIHRKYLERTEKPRTVMWIKVEGDVGDDGLVHRCLAAYCSDFYPNITVTQAKPEKATTYLPLSLDHSVWFHAPFRSDEWMLFEVMSPRSGRGRGFVVGRFWTRNGTLAMSIAQECVLRESKM